jgi:pentatricopeptide repeat protein
MVNAHVRCGDAQGAEACVARMTEASLTPCVVTYTTLINGHARAGDMVSATRALETMVSRKPPVHPNIRTVNTLLRGCLQCGSVQQAVGLLARMKRDWGVTPDASTYEYVVQLMCHSLRCDSLGFRVQGLGFRLMCHSLRCDCWASGPWDLGFGI